MPLHDPSTAWSRGFPTTYLSEALHSKDNPRQTLEEAELAGAQQKQGIKTLN